jgi:hypothetical protein
MQRQPEPTSVQDAGRDSRPTPNARRGTSRRGFLGWMGRVGITVVGGIAGATALADPAMACIQAGCCCLAKSPGGCSGSGPTFRCPSGWYKRVWYCCGGGRLQGCGECQRGSGNCRQGGTYLCSEHWTTQNVC